MDTSIIDANRLKMAKIKQMLRVVEDCNAPENKKLYFGLDESSEEKKLDKPIPRRAVHHLPLVVYKVPNPNLLRISCPYLPYSSSFGSNGRLIEPSANATPNFPTAPTNVPSYPWKNPIPRPTLRLNFYASSIVLTWQMTHKPSKDYAKIVCFDLYMHEVPNFEMSSCSWKKVLELKVEDLPLRCNSIGLRGGNTYFFALCAVDGDSRCGRFSIPKGITLLS